MNGNISRVLAAALVLAIGLGLYWLFAVPQAAPSGIIVLQASYGTNCAAVIPPAPAVNLYHSGNATGYSAQLCSGVLSCKVPVDVTILGDPVNGCAKDFTVSYICRQNGALKTAHLDGEAAGKSVALACDHP